MLTDVSNVEKLMVSLWELNLYIFTYILVWFLRKLAFKYLALKFIVYRFNVILKSLGVNTLTLDYFLKSN